MGAHRGKIDSNAGFTNTAFLIKNDSGKHCVT
jgi:hypothetical protein